MFFYQVFLLGSSAPALTYHCEDQIESGSIVSVPLQTKLKEAVVVKEVDKPSFETAPIENISRKFYTSVQLEIAKFISEYYFSSFGEAINLFLNAFGLDIEDA
ncbi:MAG: primosomal protein N', partial [Sulfurovum sp.]